MATKTLTHTMVTAAKAAPGTRLEIWDASTPGLCLRVTDKGVKSWVLRYRSKDGGQPRFKFGDARRMDLRSARAEAWRLKEEIANGNEPGAARREAKVAEALKPIRTVDDLFDAYEKACASGEWKPKKKRKRPQTTAYEKAIAERHIRPALGSFRLDDVKRPLVKGLLRKMIEPNADRRGIGAQTNRTHALMRQAFNFAISEDLMTSNPAMGFDSFHDQKPRVRTYTDDELAKLWGGILNPSALTGEDGKLVRVGRPVAIALQLCALLLQRRGEVAGMALAEVDLEAGTWLIGADRMKQGKAHRVPLPPRAVELIKEAINLAKADSDGTSDDPPAFVFPSPRGKGEKPITASALTHALDRLTAALKIEGTNVHDLRRTGSTALTSERLGVSPFIRSKVLGHGTDTGGGAAVSSTHYDANEYLSEKRRALEAWEGLLLEIVGERKRPTNVTPMREGVGA